MSSQNGGLACNQNTFVHFKEFVLFQFHLGIFLNRKDRERVSFNEYYMYLVWVYFVFFGLDLAVKIQWPINEPRLSSELGFLK